MTRYSRQDVLRILRISARQLLGWERAGLIPSQTDYGFPELAQLRTLQSLEDQRMSPRSIRNSVQAMQAVSGISNPLLESAVIRTGSRKGGRLAFRYSGTMVDPIRRQFLLDFDAAANFIDDSGQVSPARPISLRTNRNNAGRDPELQNLFLRAVQSEEQGRKQEAIETYGEILALDPLYTSALINLGTLYYHQKQYQRAEDLYRRATEADPSYVLAFFDLGNVLDEVQRPDESIDAYKRAIALAPGYGDAHYNLALAYERKGERRRALTHWQIYVRLDKSGPWADHARGQVRKILNREKLSIAHRSTAYRALPGRSSGSASLELVATRPITA